MFPRDSLVRLILQRLKFWLNKVLVILTVLLIVTGAIYSPQKGWHQGVSLLVFYCTLTLLHAALIYYRERKHADVFSEVLSQQKCLVIRGGVKESVEVW